MIELKNNYKEKTLFIILFIFLLYGFSASNTLANFYVIAGSKSVGTKISSLPYNITSSGYYYISKDLSCVSGAYGIFIEADNVTLDLKGFSLIGPGGTGSNDGIFMNVRTNIEIRNGTIRNFNRNGILELSSGGFGIGHRIINIRAIGNNYMGINIRGRAHLIEKCTAANNGNSGIHSGYGSIVRDNVCYSNGAHGINVRASNGETSSGSIVTGNTCYKNDQDGISATANITVTGNTCSENGLNGITPSTGSTVIGNTCFDNYANGISASGSTVISNTCYTNQIGIVAGEGTTVIGNTCRNNSIRGINLTTDSYVDQNTCIDNTSLNLDSCSSCTFGTNHAP